MKFKIRCESIKEFDPQKGAYVKCNREVQVDSSQVGTLVRCPGCGNDLEVIDPATLGAHVVDDVPDNEAFGGDDWGDDDPIDLSPQSTENESDGQSISETSKEVIDLVEDPAHAASAVPSASAASQPLASPSHGGATPVLQSPAATPGGPTTDLKKETFQQTSGQTLVPTTFGRAQTCHKCGSPLEDKQPVCPVCKTSRRAVYVEKQDRKAFSKKGPFGFHLWLDGITRGKTNDGEIDWTTTFGFIFSIVLMGSGLIFTFLSGIAGIFVGPPVAFTGYAIFVGLLYWGRARKSPRTKIPVLGKFAWTIMLYLVRLRRINKLPKGKVLNKSGDDSFGDQELAARRDLGNFKAIDLEGTNITDQGILYLYDHRGIQFLVLRNTNVTAEAIHDLQTTIPKTWIWY